MIIRDSSVLNLELEALIEMHAAFVCSYLLFLYNRYEAVCWLTWFVFHESNICTSCTKLNFQGWKYLKFSVVHGFLYQWSEAENYI
jgi:hypothetical protein